MTTPADFRQQIARLAAQIADRPLDASLDAWLNREHGAGSATYAALKASCEAGVAQGWLADREGGGIKYGRIFKPAADLQGFSVDVIKDRGTQARVVEQGTIGNVYRLQIMNGTERAQDYTVAVSGLPGLGLATASVLHVPATGIGTLPVRLTLPPDMAATVQGRSNPIVFEITAMQGEQSRVAREKSTFFVPR